MPPDASAGVEVVHANPVVRAARRRGDDVAVEEHHRNPRIVEQGRDPRVDGVGVRNELDGLHDDPHHAGLHEAPRDGKRAGRGLRRVEARSVAHYDAEPAPLGELLDRPSDPGEYLGIAASRDEDAYAPPVPIIARDERAASAPRVHEPGVLQHLLGAAHGLARHLMCSLGNAPKGANLPSAISLASSL